MTLSWSIVKNIQIPSTKLQINLKFKYLMTKTFNDGTFFGYSNFGYWNLPALLNKSKI